MSQIYKVFFKNISFEIKPFSKIDSKLPCIIFFDSFNEFISSVYNVLINNESCGRMFPVAASVQDTLGCKSVTHNAKRSSPNKKTNT